MANQTVYQLVRQSLLDLSVIDRDDTVDPTQLSDGLFALNSLLNRWSTERFGIYTITQEEFSLVASDGEYSIGAAGDFNTVRPVKILTAWIRSGTTDYPVEIIARENYARRVDKTTERSIPDKLYYEPTYPLGTIRLLGVPASTYTLHIESWKPLAQYTAGAEEIALPPEYQDAIRWSLAIDLAPSFSVEPSRVIVARADEGVKAMKIIHSTPVPRAYTDPIGTRNKGRFDIYGGFYR